MDASRFDTLARSLAARPSRRGLVGLVVGLGFGGALLRPMGRHAAASVSSCVKNLSCDKGKCKCCEFAENGSCSCRCCTCSGGIVGGGTVRVGGDTEATLVLLATRTADPEKPGVFSVAGQVRWTDPGWEGAGLTLESTVLTFYAPLPDIEGGRVASGWMRADQMPGEFPFILRAVDAGPTGDGPDTIELWVGDAAADVPSLADVPVDAGDPSGFRYVAEGVLVGGDLHLVELGSLTTDPADT